MRIRGVKGLGVALPCVLALVALFVLGRRRTPPANPSSSKPSAAAPPDVAPVIVLPPPAIPDGKPGWPSRRRFGVVSVTVLCAGVVGVVLALRAAPGGVPADAPVQAAPSAARGVTTFHSQTGPFPFLAQTSLAGTGLPPLGSTDGPPADSTDVDPGGSIPTSDPGSVSAPSAAGIPATALDAYRRAADGAPAGCGLPWELLAAIGQVESDHGQYADSLLYSDGTSAPPVIGILLNGSGTALIRDTDHGRLDGDPTYDHAVGPMQFIPSTWARYGVDANGDGRADPSNIYDAAAAAAAYLCAAGGDLGTSAGQTRAILAYNPSASYLSEVLALETDFRNGTSVIVVPPLAPVSPPPSWRPVLPPVDPGTPVTWRPPHHSTSPSRPSSSSPSSSSPSSTPPSSSSPSSTPPSSTPPSSTPPSSVPPSSTPPSSVPPSSSTPPSSSSPPSSSATTSAPGTSGGSPDGPNSPCPAPTATPTPTPTATPTGSATAPASTTAPPTPSAPATPTPTRTTSC